MKPHERAEKTDVPKNRIRDWKGVLAPEATPLKIQTFVFLFILSFAMTFTQFGFIGIGANGEYICYVIGLLVPVSATALLLGKGAGTLQGFLSGAVLFLHAEMQPLDLVERYFTSVLSSLVLYACIGFVLAVLFAIALRNNLPNGRKAVYLVLVSLAGSAFVSLSFVVNVFLRVVASLVSASDSGMTGVTNTLQRWADAIAALGSFGIQFLLDFLLILAVCFVVCYLMRRRKQREKSLTVRESFESQMLVVVTLVFCVLSAICYVAFTVQAQTIANEDMADELEFISDQVAEREALARAILGVEDGQTVPEAVVEAGVASADAQPFVDGYVVDKDGTVVVFTASDNTVLYTNSLAYPVGVSTNDLFGDTDADILQRISESGAMHEVLYDTSAFDQKNYREKAASSRLTTAELGYMRAIRSGEYYIMMSRPSSMIFVNRNAVMRWAPLLAFLLLAVVFALLARVLRKDVAEPIDRTNEQLALITGGDLEVEVDERRTSEFASLSDGINTTVGALRGYIAEVETRMERDLATGKAIQESALPRVFPPFPEVDKFDIFASMDAAKEVGGDFYNFFLIDDHTLGFLIADVSGKGIPGALFMMAAKTELENYISTGMELSQAIATANKRLCANNDAGMFVTVWAATLDYDTGELTYVNAGHNFPLLRHGVGGEWEWLNKKCGLFLGTFETAKYKQMTLTLEEGDELLLYTDGVNEAFSVDEEEYGNDRLEQFLREHTDMHPREIVRSLRADVARWAEGAEQSDDVTILSLEYGVAPEVTGSATYLATLDHLDEAIRLVSAELESRLCPIDVQHKVEIALEELFVNVCRYAYADKDEPGTVQVRYAYGTNPSSITVELSDQGVPFDPLKREDPTLPSSAQEAKVGGLGIFMVKRTMDDFTYMRDGDTNVVVFKKGW